MKNGTNKHSPEISAEQARLNFFSDPTSADEVRRLLVPSASPGKLLQSKPGCAMWSPVIPRVDQGTKRND